MPKHVVEPFLYYIQQPFRELAATGNKKQSSLVTVFTCWNTMVGSGIVALPWAFGESGFVLGLIITIVNLFISYRTCILMIRSVGNDDEYFDTLYKYWGKWAYYLGYISTILIMIAAETSYFINLTQMMYFLLLALLEWIFGKHIDPVLVASVNEFSLTYVVIFAFFMELLITSRKDLSIFIRLISFGSVFILLLNLLIFGTGFYGIATTNYEIWNGDGPMPKPDASMGETRYLKLWNSNFSPLAGVLGIGYFLHTISLPIVKNNANQKNNERDLFFGYLLVAFTYAVLGVMGSIGFYGVYFTDYFM